MQVIGVYEAKTNLNKLLDRVSQGEQFTITKHGFPVAVLQAPPSEPTLPISETIEAIKKFGKGKSSGKMTIKEMIEEGRR